VTSSSDLFLFVSAQFSISAFSILCTHPGQW
jgi:hypothetical protein